MSCCGGNRSGRAGGPVTRGTTPAAPVQVSLPRVVVFRYYGETSLLVFGRVTGRKYRFERPGAEVAVDPRDAPSIANVANLKEMRRT